eukprot:363276-Chlamydomonas_euryale.AAC.6
MCKAALVAEVKGMQLVSDEWSGPKTKPQAAKQQDLLGRLTSRKARHVVTPLERAAAECAPQVAGVLRTATMDASSGRSLYPRWLLASHRHSGHAGHYYHVRHSGQAGQIWPRC